MNGGQNDRRQKIMAVKASRKKITKYPIGWKYPSIPEGKDRKEEKAI